MLVAERRVPQTRVGVQIDEELGQLQDQMRDLEEQKTEGSLEKTFPVLRAMEVMAESTADESHKADAVAVAVAADVENDAESRRRAEELCAMDSCNKEAGVTCKAPVQRQHCSFDCGSS